MKRSVFGLIGAGIFIAGLLFMPTHATAQSNALLNVLGEIQQLSQADFTALAVWAQNGSAAPGNTFTALAQAQSDVLALGTKDRSALLSWLNGNGRSALYARGASDYQIGPPRAPIEVPPPTPTPNPWRPIALGPPSVSSGVQGQIQIIGGFAAVRLDGSAATACVSFKNLAPVTARRVIFEFPLFDANANQIGMLTLDRKGEFSSNIAIMSYGSFADWSGSANTIGPRGYADNCIQQPLPTAAAPAAAATYEVMRVEYDDGTVWTPGAAPTPQASP